MSDTAYQAILEAARTKFAEVGYRDVTIRSIAAEAGYSAAMVMKLMGSKEQLFWLVAPRGWQGVSVFADVGQGLVDR